MSTPPTSRPALRKPAHARPSWGVTYALLGIALAVVVGFSMLVPTPETAEAGKAGGGGGGGGKKGGGSAYTGSFTLVKLTSHPDGLIHYGDQITFTATSNATYYFVSVDCAQNGASVFTWSIGVYPGYPWSTTITLSNATSTMNTWAGGAASCRAVLWSSNADGSNKQTLSTMTFDVVA